MKAAIEYVDGKMNVPIQTFLQSKKLPTTESGKHTFYLYRRAANAKWQAMAKKTRCQGYTPKTPYEKQMVDCALQIYDFKEKVSATKAKKKRFLKMEDTEDSEGTGVSDSEEEEDEDEDEEEEIFALSSPTPKKKKASRSFRSSQPSPESIDSDWWKDITPGCRISVYWKADDKYYEATVIKQRGSSSRFHLKYDDGDTEVVDMSQEIFKFVKEKKEEVASKTKKKDLTKVEARVLEGPTKSPVDDSACKEHLMDLKEVGDSMLSMAKILKESQTRFDEMSKSLTKERKVRKKMSRKARILEIQLEEASDSIEEERSRSLRLFKENKRLRDEFSTSPAINDDCLTEDMSNENKRLKRANEQLRKDLKAVMDLYEKATTEAENPSIRLQSPRDEGKDAAQSKSDEEDLEEETLLPNQDVQKAKLTLEQKEADLESGNAEGNVQDQDGKKRSTKVSPEKDYDELGGFESDF